ncbi:putative gustatory receptor 9a, partial [Lucilia sericata]|uniref:putative gustatory receptor 9a n=1 Tax=Lucilia sericata TaxID=13632 RepID=UPI0018A83CBC
MSPTTLNKIYLYYLRFMGVSCHSNNKCTENLLIFYNLIFIILDVKLVYNFSSRASEDTADINVIQNIMVFVNLALVLAFKIVRIFIACRVIMKRKMEAYILKLFEEIEDDFQLKLFHNLELSNCYKIVFYRYFCLVEILSNTIALIYKWYYTSLSSLLTYFRFLLTLQAIRAVYLQFVLIIIKIDENLENLEKCLKINLHEQQQQKHQQKKDKQQTVGHPAEMNVFNNQCILYNVGSGVGSGGMSVVRHYLLQRIWTMKCIYGKIIQISLTCSSLFGLSVLLTNFLCICELTEIMYVAVTALAYQSFDVREVLHGLHMVLPMLIILLTMCWLSDKCSRRVIRIAKQLKTSSVPAFYIDDFIMQILQNPIKFSAYNFYELNLSTIFK